MASPLQPDLANAHVLIVEDEAFIAYDLVFAVEDAKGVPVGPAATVREALDLLRSNDIDAAILDVNLPDGHVGPVLEALHAHGVPVVVHTGTALPPEIQARFPQVPVCTKPTPAGMLTRRLAEALKQGPGRRRS